MILHLLWLLPFAVFLLSFARERRRLFNSYLLSLSLAMFILVLAGYTVTSIEQLAGRYPAILVLALLALLIPLSVFLSTAYLIFNGRQMMTFEGRRLANLLSLFYGLGILILMGLHFLPRLALLRHFLAAADFLLLYVTFLYLSYVLYNFWCGLFPIRREPDYIIILGSGLFGDKVPPLLAQRLDKGWQIYEKFGRRPRIIVSGGQGPDELVSEAQAMAAYLTEKGLDPDAILLENQSRTTYENLLFSKSLMKPESADKGYHVVVTNSFHALRAGVYMRRIGIKGRSIGSPTALYFLPSAWIRETVGLVVLYWKWHAAILGLLFLPWLIFLVVNLINWLFLP